ncbi:syntaxin-7 [Eucyclogobius newberryi]|uniref:syntaxin-7 n=1 Tax=Eucyclogobius newberryi TaxID=166745 RepID=UPI003B5A44DB
MAYQAGVPDPSALVNSISSNIHKLTLLTNDLQRAVSLVGTEQDDSQLRNSLQQKQQQGNQLAKDTDKQMKAFAALPLGPDQRQRKLQKERLLSDFSAALNTFQKTQRQAAQKEKEFVARVRAASRASVAQPGGVPADDGFRSVPAFASEMQLQAESEAMREEDLQLIQEREEAIKQLESDIVDINDIFKDLGVMVHEQGAMIDSIEANVESTDQNIHSGMQNLARAADYQSSSRKKICIIVVIAVVVAVAIGLVIWGSVAKVF